MRSRTPSDASAALDDAALLEEARCAVTERLGTSGYLRFLILVCGGRDRFEDLRRDWENLSLDEVIGEIRRSSAG